MKRKLKNLTIYLVYCSLFSNLVFAAPGDKNSASKIVKLKNRYPQSFESVFREALNNSHDYRGLFHAKKGASSRLDAANKFYYPRVSVTNEYTHFYGFTAPAEVNRGDLTLGLQARLYGSAVSDAKDAAKFSLKSSDLTLKNLELTIYYQILGFLSRIERTRYYKYQSSLLRQEIDLFVRKQKRSTDEGVSSVSDLREVELNKIRFEDAVFSATSQIETFFDQLSLQTGYIVKNPDSIGIEFNKLRNLVDNIKSKTFCVDDTVNNFGLKVQQSNLKAALSSYKAQNEKFFVEVTNDNIFNSLGDIAGDVGRFGGLKSTSNVGLRMNLQLFDYQAGKTKDAAKYAYFTAKDDYLKNSKEVLAQYKAEKRNLDSLLIRKSLLREQIQKNRALLNNQKFEISTDKTTFLQISTSLFAFNQLYLTLLDLDIQLYDSIFLLKSLESSNINLSEI